MGAVGYRGTLQERLMKRVVVDPKTGCWNFTGAWMAGGYGGIGIATSKTALAHRVSYQLFVGPIPEDHDLHHKCENKRCINPDHLEPLTRLAHQIKTPTTSRNRTHCPKGHPLSGKNLVAYDLRTKNIRKCRECRRAIMKAYYQSSK